MGKILIIKGADFSQVSIDEVIYDYIFNNWTEGILSSTNGGINTESENERKCITSQDYADITIYNKLNYDNHLWVSAICFYDSNKTFIKRILITDKTTTRTPIDISSINDSSNAKYMRVSFALDSFEFIPSKLTQNDVQDKVTLSLV